MKNNLRLKYCLFASLLLSIYSNVFSQSATDSSKLSITGSVDVNYNYNFNSPASMNNGYRNFDVKENQFNINLAKITLQKNASPVGFRIDVGYGQAHNCHFAILSKPISRQLFLSVTVLQSMPVKW